MASITSHGSGSVHLQRLRSHGQDILLQIRSKTCLNASDVQLPRRQAGELCALDMSKLEGDQRAGTRVTAEELVQGKANLSSVAEAVKLYGVPPAPAVSGDLGEEPTHREAPSATDMVSPVPKREHVRDQAAKTPQPWKHHASRGTVYGDGYQGKRVMVFSSPESVLEYLLRLEQRT